MDHEKHEKIIAVILSGGVGSRMGSEIPKQYMELMGKPVLAYSLVAFQNSTVDEIYVVCDPDHEKMILSDIIDKYGIIKFSGFAKNGQERVWSVKNGIDKALEKTCACSGADQTYDNMTFGNVYLLIHDGARPLLSRELIECCIDSVKKNAAVVPGVPLKDTIKEVCENKVTATPDRHSFVAVQTPQCFRADVITDAYAGFKKAGKGSVDNSFKDEPGFIPTDDASLIEMFTDTRVQIIPGDERNLKITTPEDMRIAELFLKL